MKGSRIFRWILGGTFMTAAAILFGLWNWRVNSEAESRLRQASMLEVHDQSLRAAVTAGTLQIRELMAALQVASNRIAEVERGLDLEQKTHEPLRRQVEGMLVEQISLKDNLGKRDKTVGGLSAALSVARKTNEVLGVQFVVQRDQIVKLEMELKGASEREAVVQSQLDELRNKGVELKAKLEETRQRLMESERLCGELQKQKEGMMTTGPTNTASTVSLP